MRFQHTTLVVCQFCGKSFETPSYRGLTGRGKYCSQRCLGRARKPIGNREEKFRAKVNYTSSPFGCHIWLGKAGPVDGYGRFTFDGKTEPAHRAAWRIAFGDVPDTLVVCHNCAIFYPKSDISYRLCVNVEHLWLGTRPENMADMYAKGRGDTSGLALGRVRLRVEH